jgi:hypothetical protein
VNILWSKYRKVSYLQICKLSDLLSHSQTLSCAGLSIRIPGIQGTAWDRLGLAAHIPGPTGVTRDCNDLLNLKVSYKSLFCTILVT